MLKPPALAATLAALALATGACHSSSGNHAVDASGNTPDAGAPADAAPANATIRVHYPAGSHTVTIRGSAGGLNWNTGAAMTAQGSDVYSFELSALTAPLEWKPLLDDTTWSLGPNYHVAPGATLDIYPHFTSTAGQVVTLIADFHSTTLDNDRAIYAYLPASYNENTDATYPVIYMQDGQNLWSTMPQISMYGMTWNVDTAFDTATAQGACSSKSLAGWGAQPLGGTPTLCNGDGDCSAGDGCATFPEAIVIGVPSTANRTYEYTPTVDPTNPGGGGADLYLTMLISELKPTIDGQLRTRPDPASTLLAGSSFGGLVTAYAGTKHPDVFTRLGELSPAAWWDDDVIVSDVAATSGAAVKPAIVYIDSAMGENADDENENDLLAQAYLDLGYVDGKNFRHVLQAGAQHNEIYWAERFPGAMQLLLGTR